MNRLLHTPEGVRDIYCEESRNKNLLIKRMSKILDLYGYQDIQTPTFEFFDIFNRERGTVPSKNMYKFFDREGYTLVLRPDITPSIARAVSKYFKDERIPLRFSYCGNTFINNSSLQGKMKETTQLGCELIGDDSIDADAEIVALAVNLLLESGLRDFQISIDNVAFFKALVAASGMNEDEEDELRNLIESKNYFAVETFVEQLSIPEDIKNLFLRLPAMFGSFEVLSQAKAITKNEEALEAIRHLEKLYGMIIHYGYEKYVTIDLGMLSEYDYYTGIIFRGYTYGTGDAIVKGGRYDKLIGQFGKDAASVGFAVVIDELLLAISRQKISLNSAKQVSMVLYEEIYRQQAMQTAQYYRALKRSVAMVRKDPELTMDDYIEFGKKYNHSVILHVFEDRIERIDTNDGSVKAMPIPEF